jgi:organizing structure protein 2
VGVATLTGSIITRTRSPVLRFLVPPAFFLASLNQFLPKTSHNLREYVGGLEDKYAPNLAHKHDVSIAHTKMTWDLIKYHTRDSREKLSDSVVAAVGKVQDLTGLKLQEAFGWSQANVIAPAREVAEEKAKDALEVIEEVVEDKIEDIKRLV